MIVMMAGLPGTGKSTLAHLLDQRTSGAVIDKDVVRAALFAPQHIEHSRLQNDFCQEIMLQTAGYLLAKRSSTYIFLDGRTFSRQYQRQRVIEFCSEVETRWAILECVCGEKTALGRLQRAATEHTHPAMNRTPELYRHLRETWEPIDLPKLTIDTDNSSDFCALQAMRYLSGMTA